MRGGGDSKKKSGLGKTSPLVENFPGWDSGGF